MLERHTHFTASLPDQRYISVIRIQLVIEEQQQCQRQRQYVDDNNKQNKMWSWNLEKQTRL